jgi:hypothetical protein
MSAIPGSTDRLVMTDIDIPFGRLIFIMVKFVLAAIPALLIVWMIFFAIGIALTAIFGVSFMHLWTGPERAI